MTDRNTLKPCPFCGDTIPADDDSCRWEGCEKAAAAGELTDEDRAATSDAIAESVDADLIAEAAVEFPDRFRMTYAGDAIFSIRRGDSYIRGGGTVILAVHRVDRVTGASVLYGNFTVEQIRAGVEPLNPIEARRDEMEREDHATVEAASAGMCEVEDLSIAAKTLLRRAAIAGDDGLIEAIRTDVRVWKGIIDDEA